MPTIDILGEPVEIEFLVGEGATEADLDRYTLLAGVEEMAALVNSKAEEWSPEYRGAFCGIGKIVFFAGQVMNGDYLMDRPFCDLDDAQFWWEAEEFMRNTNADVRANTFFHDCWHVVQFKAGGYAYEEHEQVWREVDAIDHQIAVARTLGCDADEIGHLENFQGDQQLIIARLDEGVEQLARHRAGALGRNA